MSERNLSPAMATAERLRKRHNAEKRFKLYGQIALGIAIGFLALLLVSIASRATTAFSRHMVEITLERPDLAETSNITVSGVNGAVRDRLLEQFPEAQTERAARSDVFSITTRLAVIPLRDRLRANPEIAQDPIVARLALSDDLDLYLKNEIRRHRSEPLGPAGRLSQTEIGLFRLTAAGPDGFIAFQDRIQALGDE